ncbi:MAG: DUF502 domain-containing protein [Candidatus Sumerlaeia bacterium]|nr:DUF502 domain-containing protein [Candidatus Sumerlaeia bacterium]
MAEEKKVERLERFISRAEARRREPPPPKGYWARNYAIIRRRIITGILFLIPIATTLWFLNFLLSTIYIKFEPLIKPILIQQWKIAPDSVAYKTVGIVMSVIAALAMLYLFGLITSRTAVKRLISLAESLVVRIPLVKFFYKTSKQIAETLALPTGSARKKVVAIDFPRIGIKTIAFATGETPLESAPEPYVNVFVPTTPNPTSGYLVLLPRESVWETNLTFEEAMRFIVSGGILPPNRILLRPYQTSLVEEESTEETELLPGPFPVDYDNATDTSSHR